jgi:arginine exporter protein ArgO
VRALVEGILAGYGIAIPVGPIAVLLVDTGIRRGFGVAAAAALGAATADLIWATVAALAGLAVAGALEPWADTVRIASGCVLLGLAGYRFVELARAKGTGTPNRIVQRGLGASYVTFLGLTLLNPATVAYFAALILSLAPGTASGVGGKFLFVAGAFAASASWQLLLAVVSSGLHRRLSERARLLTAVLGNAVIVALALRLLI